MGRRDCEDGCGDVWADVREPPLCLRGCSCVIGIICEEGQGLRPGRSLLNRGIGYLKI